LHLGFALVPLPVGSKIPPNKGWPDTSVTTLNKAQARWGNSNENAGIHHRPSGTIVLDVDESEGTAQALERVGINLQELLDAPGPKIKSPRGVKPIYRLPEGIEGKRLALAWPTRETCELPKKQQKLETIFELRAGNTQDVAPGSVHPSGALYEWIDKPESREDIPVVPDNLLALYQNWAALKSMMLEAAPGYKELDLSPGGVLLGDDLDPEHKSNAVSDARNSFAGSARRSEGNNVIGEFNKRYTLHDVLISAGCIHKGGNRYLDPSSTTGAAGLVILKGDDGKERVYSHGSSSPLYGDHAHDAFGTWVELEHGGDVKAAVKEAAQEFGMAYTSDENVNFNGFGTAPQNDDGLEWGELQELPPGRPPAPNMTPVLIPEALRPWLVDASERMSARLELVAIPALVVLGSLSGRKVAVRPKAKDTSWTEPLNLWGVTVSPPSSLKTPSQNEATSHIRALANEAMKEFIDGAANREAQLELARMELAELKKGSREAGKKTTPDQLAQVLERIARLEAENHPRRFIVNDSTTEKLAELLLHNPNGVLVQRDELMGLLKSFDKTGREGDRAFYLEAWGGKNSFDVDRIGRGSLHVPAMCLSVIGTTQPGRFENYIDEAIGGGEGADGFLQRFQLLVWPDDQPDFVDVERDRDHEAYNRARGVYRKAAEFVPANYPGIALGNLEGELPSIGFAADAQELFSGWRSNLMQRIRGSELKQAEGYQGHLGKYPGLTAKLALLFHLVEYFDGKNGGGAISLENTELAIQWATYLEQHAQKVYAVELQQGQQAMRMLAAQIEAGKIKDGATLKSIYDKQLELLGTKKDLFKAIEQLEKYGWVRRQKGASGNKGGRPTELLRIHPEKRD
jgi:hypothetical protein